MGRGGKIVIWSAIALLGLVLVELAVYNLVQEGSCASGGPYEIRNPCPGSTWWWVGGLVLGGVVFYIGAALLTTEFAGDWLGTVLLSGASVASGLVALVAVYSPGARGGSRTGGVIICIVWIAIGILPSFRLRRPAAKDPASG